MDRISFKSLSLALTVLFADLCVSGPNSYSAEVAAVAGPSVQAVRHFRQTVDSGIVFIDEVFMDGPYVIEATETSVSVNGVVCVDLPESVADQSRPRRARPFDGQRPPVQEHFGEEFSGRGRRSGVRSAEQFVETLTQGGAVVANTGNTPCHLQGSDYHTFCDVLMSDVRSDEQVLSFARLPDSDRQFAVWEAWLHRIVLPENARMIMQSTIDELDRTEADGLAKVVALQRLDSMSYPLTVLGMLLSVFALGHVLKWTAKSIVAEQNAEYSPEVTRCVEVALLLMLAMSLIDLAWTILAGQAGVMKEVNPLAASYLESPLQLVAFKVTATGLGCGILYAWRRRKQAQDATWWMCLVCVLLTFRWVVFDSVVG